MRVYPQQSLFYHLQTSCSRIFGTFLGGRGVCDLLFRTGFALCLWRWGTSRWWGWVGRACVCRKFPSFSFCMRLLRCRCPRLRKEDLFSKSAVTSQRLTSRKSAFSCRLSVGSRNCRRWILRRTCVAFGRLWLPGFTLSCIWWLVWRRQSCRPGREDQLQRL